jgi:metallo-beta-lactamase class B
MQTAAKTLLHACAAAVATLALAAPAGAAPPAAGTPNAATMALWKAPQKPFKLYGNSWYVGTQGLSSILITSDYGHVLIDGGVPEAAPQILANIKALGFKPTDIKALLNSHSHFDHAGGLAELQAATGAPIYVRRPSETVVRTGKSGRDDPQAGPNLPAMPPAKGQIWIVSDQQLLGVGSIRLQALATAGHTPGGTTWTWESCEGNACLKLVYADSLTPLARAGFRYTGDKDYPSARSDFEQAFATLESLPCDVLVTPHPESVQLFERVATRDATQGATLKQDGACKAYAAKGRAALAERLAAETQ